MKELSGKTAVITGAANGIGRAMAMRFADAGMNIVLADLDLDGLESARQEVGRRGVQAVTVPTDVSDGSAVEHLRDEAIARFGRVNVVCNNAGLGNVGSMMNVLGTPADWRWVLGVNLWGVIHGHQTFLPHLMEHGDGYIVNTASMAGLAPGHNPYAGSKWAIVGITGGLYQQLRSQGSSVGVSCLCPAAVATKAPINSQLRRPDWAGDEDLPADVKNSVVDDTLEMLSKGMPPADVAELVHDAVVSEKFWIFTDMSWVASLEGQFKSILSAENPPPMTWQA